MPSGIIAEKSSAEHRALGGRVEGMKKEKEERERRSRGGERNGG